MDNGDFATALSNQQLCGLFSNSEDAFEGESGSVERKTMPTGPQAVKLNHQAQSTAHHLSTEGVGPASGQSFK
eukprot:967489-Rhodomonas_salina.1